MKTFNNLLANKMFVISGAIVLFLAASGSSFLYLYFNNTAVAKDTDTAKTISSVSTTPKPTATTDDVQTELDSINSKSSNLDNEVTSVTNGLNDKQTNLDY